MLLNSVSLREECWNTGWERNFARADGARQIMESGGLITAAALAHDSHGTHAHLPVGVANQPEEAHCQDQDKHPAKHHEEPEQHTVKIDSSRCWQVVLIEPAT